MQLFCVWLSQFCQGVQITLSYTLAAYMVRRIMGATASEQAVGQMIGLLAAAGFFARFLVAYAWGSVSDTIGRKVVVQMGMLGGVLDMLLFGTLERYWPLLTARFALGLLASVNVATRSMVGDVSAIAEKTRLASATSLAWSIGSIAGYFIAGSVSDPCSHSHSWFQPSFCQPGALFRQRPYLPPCLVAAALNLLGLTFNTLFMEETLPRIRCRPNGAGRTYHPVLQLRPTLWPAQWRHRDFLASWWRSRSRYSALASSEAGPDTWRGAAAPPDGLVGEPVSKGEGDVGGSGRVGRFDSASSASNWETSSKGTPREGHMDRMAEQEAERDSVPQSPFHSEPAEHASIELVVVPHGDLVPMGTRGGHEGRGRPGDPRPCPGEPAQEWPALPMQPSWGPPYPGGTVGSLRGPWTGNLGPIMPSKDLNVGPEGAQGESSVLRDTTEAESRRGNPDVGPSEVYVLGSSLHCGETKSLGEAHSQMGAKGSGLDEEKLQLLHEGQPCDRHCGEEILSSSSGAALPSGPGPPRAPRLNGSCGDPEGASSKENDPNLLLGTQPLQGTVASVGEAVAARCNGTFWVTSPLETADRELPWYRQAIVVKALVGAGTLSLMWCYLDELTPIYVSADLDKGGLAMKLSSFTNANLASGGVLVPFTLFVYPAYSKRVGPMKTCLTALSAAVPSTLIIPAARFAMPAHPLLAEALIWLGIMLRALCKTCSFTAFMVIVNVVAPRSQVGAVNGMTVTLASLGRSIGPALSGAVWALSSSLGFTMHSFIGFGAVAIALAAARLVYGRLRVPDS
eukprot:jgi/Botrbrau1/8302/Bobra.0251s0028.1